MEFSEFLALIESPEDRASRSEELINQWYDWATATYRKTWGDRFHFARFTGDETFEEACRNQETVLLEKLGLGPGMRVLDMGSGVGGPARDFAAKSGASIVGVDLSPTRVELANRKAEEEGLSERCQFQVGNITALPFDDATFDAVYSIEVGCYVPDKQAFYRSAARVIKPGATFAGWDWALTRHPSPEEQAQWVEPLLKYQAKPNLATVAEIHGHLAAAGFDVLEFEDLAPQSVRPWWGEVELRISDRATRILAGARPDIDLLIKSSVALVNAGKAGLLTPICFWRATRRAAI